jgi:hypothetical protein
MVNLNYEKSEPIKLHFINYISNANDQMGNANKWMGNVNDLMGNDSEWMSNVNGLVGNVSE